MKRKEIFEEVERIIENVTNTDDAIIVENSTFADINVDSLDLIEIVLKLKKKFDINISYLEFEGLQTVGDIIDLVDAKYHNYEE